MTEYNIDSLDSDDMKFFVILLALVINMYLSLIVQCQFYHKASIKINIFQQDDLKKTVQGNLLP